MEETDLLSDQVRDHVSSRPQTLSETFEDDLLRDVPLESDLEHDEWVRKRVLVVLYRREKDKEVVGGRVGHKLEVVGGVLIVRGDVESHHPLKEELRCGVEREKSVPIDVEQLAVRRMGAALDVLRHNRRVEAKHRVEPPLDLVSGCVSNGFLELDFPKGSAESGCRLDGRWGLF